MVKLGIELGNMYKDIDAGFTGYATVETVFRNGCCRYLVEPVVVDNEDPVRGSVFDAQDLLLVKGKRVKIDVPEPKIAMNTLVRDKVTQLTGVVVAVSRILGGNPEYGVQPKKLAKNGSPLSASFFNEDRLEVIKKGPEKKETDEKPPGGPSALDRTSACDRQR